MTIQPSVQTYVPLTNWQKARLLADCLPFLGFLVICLAVLTLFRGVFGVGLSSILIRLLIMVLLGLLGYQALQRIRDLRSGQANVVIDVLERSGRSRGSSSRMFFARFQQLGRLRIMPKAHFQSHNGQRYRVTYSPISRIVWALDPIP